MAKRSSTYSGKLRGHFICGRITRAEYIACLRGRKAVSGFSLYDVSATWAGEVVLRFRRRIGAANA